MADSRVLEIILRLKDEASKQLGQVDSYLKKNASNFQMVGTAITGAGLSLTLISKQFIDAAAQAEQTEIAFTTMLGSVEKAKEFYADLVNFAARTPFELTGLSTAAKQLLAYGFAQEEVIPNLRALGDIASGVGMDKLPNLILAFGQVRAATRLTGMELRQFTEAGVPLLDELSKMLGKPTAEIQEMVSAGEIGFPMVQQALMNLTGESGRFANLMDKQSKSFSGMISNLRDQINIFLTQGGKPLIEAGKEIIKFLADIVSKGNEWATQHPELTKLIGITTAAMGALFLILGPVIALLGLMAAAAAGLGISLGALALTIGLVPLAIAGLIAAGYLLITNWEWVKAKTIEIWNIIVNFLKEHWDSLIVIIGGPLGLIVALIIKNWDTIKDTTVSVWTSIKDFFSGVWEEIKNIFQGAIDWITDKINSLLSAIDKVKSAASSVVPSMSPGASLNPFSSSFQLPHFAKGGIVTRPTLGVFGEAGPEAIIPLNKMGAMGGITINIYGDVSGQELVSKVQEGIMNSLRLNSRLPV